MYILLMICPNPGKAILQSKTSSGYTFLFILSPASLQLLRYFFQITGISSTRHGIIFRSNAFRFCQYYGYQYWKGDLIMLTTEQLRTFKQTIQRRIKELREELEGNDEFGLSQSFTQQATGELSNYDNHPGDTATDLYEREKDLSLDEHAKQELAELQLALERIGKGKYGMCTVCGKDISSERLKTLPTATTCVEHSPSQHTSNHRPAEEDVLGNSFGEYVNDHEQANFFDAEDSWQRAALYGTSETPSDFNEQQMDYDRMYIDSDELHGYVEEIETFLSSDIAGKPTGVIPNERHEHYEDQLDDYESQAMQGSIEDTDLNK